MPKLAVHERTPLFSSLEYVYPGGGRECFNKISHENRFLAYLAQDTQWGLSSIGLRLAFSSRSAYGPTVTSGRVRVGLGEAYPSLLSLPFWAFLDESISLDMTRLPLDTIADDPLKALLLLARIDPAPYVGISRSIPYTPRCRTLEGETITAWITLGQAAVDTIRELEQSKDGYANIAIYFCGIQIRELPWHDE